MCAILLPLCIATMMPVGLQSGMQQLPSSSPRNKDAGSGVLATTFRPSTSMTRSKDASLRSTC
jgi:hypothetical protein